MNEELQDHISKLRENNKECIIVTMVNARGSIPQEIGARIIVGSEGLLFGTIGGGKVEEKAIAHSQAMLVSVNTHDFVEWNLQTDVKMTCGGVLNLFFERMSPDPKWNVAIFGAGHVAQELVRLLLKLNCSITCIDPRQDWLNKLPEHSKIHTIKTVNMAEEVRKLAPNSFIASMTMGHAFDLPILREALSLNQFPYIGVIGSETKALVIKNDLRKNGIKEEAITQLHCPIGEAFGNNQPAEIAISIVAQLIKIRDCKN